MTEEIAPTVNETRQRIIEILAMWPEHSRTAHAQEHPTSDPYFVPMPDSILLSLIHHSVTHDQNRISKLRGEIKTEKEIIQTLHEQLRACREAGYIHAIENPRQEVLAA